MGEMVHKCPSGRNDVLVVKEIDGVVNIKQNLDISYATNVVENIRFCPFCGVKLWNPKKK